MKKYREVLSCVFDKNKSQRATALFCSVSRQAVSDYIIRFQLSKLSWPIPEYMTNEELYLKLFPKTPKKNKQSKLQVDYQLVHLESKRKGFTLTQMYNELIMEKGHTNQLSYAHFCRSYREFKDSLKISLRRVKVPGELCMVDYAGKTMQITDSKTGTKRDVQIFVGVLGYSNYTFCEATESQKIEDWIGSHVRMFEYFAGTPELVIHDNLRSAVTKSSIYTPLINESYKALCEHYDIHPFPARAYKPKDKAGAEITVQIVTRWILFSLRNRTFFSLAELNLEIGRLRELMNERKFKQLPGSRLSNWIEHEKPKLKQLPNDRYQFALWSKCRVGQDYHVHIGQHYYSVPYTIRNSNVMVRMTEDCIEIIHKDKRIASHLRSHIVGGKSTKPEHMAPQHRVFSDWAAAEALQWANGVGEPVSQLLQLQLRKINNRHFGYRLQGALKKLVKDYGNERVNSACSFALSCGVTSSDGLKRILAYNLDSQCQDPKENHQSINTKKADGHENLRGRKYYENKISDEGNHYAN